MNYFTGKKGETMCQKILAIIVLVGCLSTLLINRFYAQELESKSTSDNENSLRTGKKSFYITPYVGSSTLVGNFGIEFQYKNYGYNIGLLKSIDEDAINNILCGGIRYYFNPHHHSWVVGVGGGVVLDELEPDDLGGETGTVMDRYVGILIGYRWIWWNKLHLNIGAGPNYIKWKKIREGNKHKYLPMVELVIGYSFY
jgi:hypothetical protein